MAKIINLKAFFARKRSFFRYAFCVSEGNKARMTRLRAAERTKCIQLFKDITPSGIVAMTQQLVDSGYTNIYIKEINFAILAVIRHACEKGLLSKNPYKSKLLLPKGKENDDHRYLSTTSLSKLEQAEYPTTSLRLAATLYTFQAHTGLSYSDLMSCTTSNVTKDERGQYWLRGKRKKSGSNSWGGFNVPLDRAALAIYRKFRSKSEGAHIFPRVLCESYNKQLKKIAKIAGIPERLTTHTARHTFATQQLENGVSMPVIKEMMGHSQKSNITWLYAIVTRELIRKEVVGRK